MTKNFFYKSCLPVNILLVCLLFAAPLSAQTLRLRTTINDSWKFFPGDAEGGPEKREFDDKNWQKVSVPHTWNAADTFDDEPGYRRGTSWYRRELKLNADLANRRIFLYFEAANQTADVFINEKFLGRHTGGYSAFAFEITEFVSFEQANLIAVKVDNTLLKDIPPLDADFNMYGGIYRDVWLVATADAHFKVTDHASTGVKIETPQVAADAATVKISGTVVNQAADARQLEITSTVFDAENRPVVSVNTPLKIAPKTEMNFEQTAKPVKNPKLWSPEAPNLYRVQSVIREKGKALDEIYSPLGFRWFRFDAREGFFLNGKHLKLQGTNKHQDYKGLGNAVPDRLQVRDMEIIKENGFNFVRLGHYPHDPSVLEAADRLGLLIWEEIPVVNLITISEAFNENSKTMLRDMIRQHRNHPSIILWGYMNEVFLRSPKTDADITETFKLARELEKICKAEDPHRATAIAFDSGARERYYASGLAEVTDVIGWNLYMGWYSGVFEDFGRYIDEQHKRLPHRPLIISEYGANADLRLHSLAPKRFDSTVEWQRTFHEIYLSAINERRFIAGSAIWNQFDFGAEYRGETIPHLNQKGMYTYDRQPKDVAFFYKANFAAEPVVHIAARDWRFRTGTPRQKVDVYSNLSELELFQNGVSLGKKTVGANKKATWETTFADGKNSFIARGAKDDILLSDAAEIHFTDTSKGFDEAFREIAVNVGSNADFIDAGQTVWTADQTYRTGSFGGVGSGAQPVSTLRNALGTLDDPLFQTMSEGLNAYRFDVPDGVYEIELRFVEAKFKEAGQRVFTVGINGQTVLENLDLTGKVGMMQSLTQKFQVSARQKQGIVINFTAHKDKPVLSGVRVKRIF